ncbi:unnamed protein product [Polarella glacialis]|uniref:Hexose transporter 1 n=1 Tax=Polarella glacialis TaxID=89957 RepID=A0A813DDV7_POLGL|nr:unnamed protein product [Polarella glacialis]
MESPSAQRIAARDVLAFAAVCLAPLTAAMSLGFTSPALTTMTGEAAGLPPAEAVPPGLLVFHGGEDSEAASWFSALVNLGALLGALGGGYLRQEAGLPAVLRAAAVFVGGGMALVAIGNSEAELCLARVVVGLGVGLQSISAPALIAELAPPRLRGVLGTFNSMAILLGVLIAFLFGGLVFRAGSEGQFCNWRRLAYFISLMSAALLVGSFALRPAQRDRSPTEVASTQVPLLQQLKTHRKLFLAGLVPMVWQQLSGINSVVFFGQTLLADAGIQNHNAIGATVLLVQLLGVTCIAAPLVERVGRRPLLVVSALGMSLGGAALAFCLQYLHGSWLAVIALYAYVLAFAVGLGPVPWLLLPELGLPLRVRIAAASLATAANWGCSFLVTGPPNLALERACGTAGSYLVLSLSCLLGAVLMWLVVPETRFLQSEVTGRFRLECQDQPDLAERSSVSNGQTASFSVSRS